MQKEKCFREINDTLAKTISQSILKQFASNLGVEIYQGEQIKQKRVLVEAEDKDGDGIADSADEGQTSRFDPLTEAEVEKQQVIHEFNKLKKKGDEKGQTKLIKSLTTETIEDINMHLRQKNGTLRFGDVITINFQKEIFDTSSHK